VLYFNRVPPDGKKRSRILRSHKPFVALVQNRSLFRFQKENITGIVSWPYMTGDGLTLLLLPTKVRGRANNRQENSGLWTRPSAVSHLPVQSC